MAEEVNVSSCCKVPIEAGCEKGIMDEGPFTHVVETSMPKCPECGEMPCDTESIVLNNHDKP